MFTEERLDQILLTSELNEDESYDEAFDAVCMRIKALFEAGQYKEHALAIMNMSFLVGRYGWPNPSTGQKEGSIL